MAHGWMAVIPSAVTNIRVYPSAGVPGTSRACVKGRLKNEHESSSLPWIEI